MSYYNKQEQQLQEQQHHKTQQGTALSMKPDKWEYKTRQQLKAQDPSLRDGLNERKVQMYRRQFIKIVSQAGMSLKVPQWGIFVAALLCHRFFSRKSMKYNDRYVVAQACLHLALKIEETPKSIREVVKECLRTRYGKQGGRFYKAVQPDELEKEKEETLVAERAVLYALDFDLNVNHPYRFLVQHMHDFGMVTEANHPDTPLRHLFQNAWNFINDSIRSTLLLQYSPEVLASAALFLANELNTRRRGEEVDIMRILAQRDPTFTGSFYDYFKVTAQQVEDIGHQILDMYEETKILATSESGLQSPAPEHVATPLPSAP